MSGGVADQAPVLSTDFENGSWEPWTQNGGPSLSVVDGDGGKALLVGNRSNDWDGIKSPGNLLQPGAEYVFSMKAKLAPGVAGSPGIRFVVEPAYTWVGNTTMTSDGWATVTGSFTAPRGRTRPRCTHTSGRTTWAAPRTATSWTTSSSPGRTAPVGRPPGSRRPNPRSCPAGP